MIKHRKIFHPSNQIPPSLRKILPANVVNKLKKDKNFANDLYRKILEKTFLLHLLQVTPASQNNKWHRYFDGSVVITSLAHLISGFGDNSEKHDNLSTLAACCALCFNLSQRSKPLAPNDVKVILDAITPIILYPECLSFMKRYDPNDYNDTEIHLTTRISFRKAFDFLEFQAALLCKALQQQKDSSKYYKTVTSDELWLRTNKDQCFSKLVLVRFSSIVLLSLLGKLIYSSSVHNSLACRKVFISGCGLDLILLLSFYDFLNSESIGERSGSKPIFFHCRTVDWLNLSDLANYVSSQTLDCIDVNDFEKLYLLRNMLIRKENSKTTSSKRKDDLASNVASLVSQLRQPTSKIFQQVADPLRGYLPVHTKDEKMAIHERLDRGGELGNRLDQAAMLARHDFDSSERQSNLIHNVILDKFDSSDANEEIKRNAKDLFNDKTMESLRDSTFLDELILSWRERRSRDIISLNDEKKEVTQTDTNRSQRKTYSCKGKGDHFNELDDKKLRKVTNEELHRKKRIILRKSIENMTNRHRMIEEISNWNRIILQKKRRYKELKFQYSMHEKMNEESRDKLWKHHMRRHVISKIKKEEDIPEAAIKRESVEKERKEKRIICEEMKALGHEDFLSKICAREEERRKLMLVKNSHLRKMKSIHKELKVNRLSKERNNMITRLGQGRWIKIEGKYFLG